jgi:hypothetical protein
MTLVRWLLSLILFAPLASGQVTYITFQNSTGTIIQSFRSGFQLKCGTGTTCAVVGNTITMTAAGSGGTVTNFTAGTLTPLFTTSVATGTTTPALSFTLTNAGAYTLFANNSGAPAAPSYTTFDSVFGSCSTATSALTFNTTTHAFGCNVLVLPSNEAGASSNFLTAYNSTTGAFSKAQPTWANIDKTTSSIADITTRTCATLSDSGTGCSGTSYPGLVAHNLLSASHGDTTTSAAVRGGAIFAVGASPLWVQVAHSAATGGYWKWNGTDVVASTLAASGVGTPTACTNQFVTGLTLASDAAPTSTCTTATLASAQFANQGTTTTVLHGNAAGNPSFAGVNLVNDAVANQGTTITVLHGNAAGQPAFGAIVTGDVDSTIKGFTASNVTPNAMASAATDTKLVEFTLPAGYLNVANKVFRVTANGTWTTGTTQTPTWNFKIKLCTVSGCGSGTALILLTWTSAASTASTTQTWLLNANIGVTTVGANGKLLGHGFADLPVGATANLAWAGYHDVNTAESATIDLTASLYLDVMANVSTQSGTKNSCTYNTAKVTP